MLNKSYTNNSIKYACNMKIKKKKWANWSVILRFQSGAFPGGGFGGSNHPQIDLLFSTVISLLFSIYLPIGKGNNN